ncbi:hypothetical protein DV737_g3692, partial [Chaetothyriales sp. CBS 132003]
MSLTTVKASSLAYAILIGAAVVYVLYLTWDKISHKIRAQRLGCKPAFVRPSRVPLGIDNLKRSIVAANEQVLQNDDVVVYEEMGGRSTWVQNVLGSWYHNTVDPENIKAILATQFKDFELGSLRFNLLGPLIGHGIFTTDGKEWQHHRSLLRPQFTRSQISDMKLEETHVQQLFDRIHPDSDSWTSQVDLAPLFFNLTLDSATEFLFGQSVGSQLVRGLDATKASKGDGATKDGADDGERRDWPSFGRAFDRANSTIAMQGRLVDYYFLYQPKSLTQDCKEIHRFADYFVQRALSRDPESATQSEDGDSKKEGYVFLNELAKTTRDPYMLRSQLLNVLLAGRDTTAGLLGWTFYLLARHSDYYTKMHRTVVDAFGPYSSDTSSITFESLKSCQPLQHLLSEVLRLHPVVPENSRRAVRDTTLPRGGGPDGLSPIYIRKGEEVLYNVHVMHHRKDLWGDDASEFRPERWVGFKAGWEYLPFNGGPRICLGQQFALTEAGYVVSRILQKYDKIENLDPEKVVRHQYTQTTAPPRSPRVGGQGIDPTNILQGSRQRTPSSRLLMAVFADATYSNTAEPLKSMVKVIAYKGLIVSLLDLIVDLIVSLLDLIISPLDLIVSPLDLIVSPLGLIISPLGLIVIHESQALENALAAVELVLNDDIAGAEAGLAGGSSAFHKVAFGTLAFMKAALGVEQEVMKEASDQLAEAEASAAQSLAKAQRDISGRAPASAIYDKGSEFMLCQAEAQVMMAIVGVLNESLTESIRGFYRLRKAYLSLDALARMEDNFVKSQRAQSLDRHQTASKESLAPSLPKAATPAKGAENVQPYAPSALSHNPNSPIFSSPLDIFIHTGTNLMFGVLNLLISIVPPAFSKLLFIVGFRGDRDRALRMLWQASKFHNINGGLAGLVIFGWYNGLVSFCDIVPDEDPDDGQSIAGYPAGRLQALLHDMRTRYPKSNIWLIEEARMAAADRDLNTTLELLSRAGGSSLKQLEAMRMFEMSLVSMYAHRYQLCADSFLKCVDLSGWSQALYYYLAGAAHVAAYRECSGSDKDKAQQHKALAEQYIRSAPSKVGKKKMMGRQLPFDLFVVRKVAKWSERATRRGCDLIDAIGVSPLEEMIYLWGGYKKMDDANLEHSLRNVAWSEGEETDEVDEKAGLALLRSVILRNLRRHDDSMAVLKRELLDLEPQALRGPLRDEWPAPAAHHEMAVNFGANSSDTDTSSAASNSPAEVDVRGDAILVHGAKTHIDRAKNWGSYELDARLGVKITAALNSIRLWEGRYTASRSASG